MTWVEEVGEWLTANREANVPDAVVHAVARTTLDTIGGALAAQSHEAVAAMHDVADSRGGRSEASLLDSPGHRTSVFNAILVNGTLIRALDCNDMFVLDGDVRGHPSDNIAVALAVAEAQDAPGQDYVRAVALGYELYWRIQDGLFARSDGHPWDHVSASGMVSAAMSSLLMRADNSELTAALAIGASQGYTLGQVRKGDVSSLKTLANSVTAANGYLAARMARAGLRGPAEALEGQKGLLRALQLANDPEILAELTAPITEWKVTQATTKLFPAVGTSQCVIQAAIDLAGEPGLFADDIEQIDVWLSDTRAGRSHTGDPARHDPHSREAADHSLPFLVAVALEDGDMGLAQFQDERWDDPRTRGLMSRVRMSTDPSLNQYARFGYPGAVAVTTKSGQRFERRVVDAPGTPGSPLTEDDILRKMGRLGDDVKTAVARISADVLAVGSAPGMGGLVESLVSAAHQ